jgi:hypothetical protein
MARSGKYGKIVETLPRYTTSDVSYQERVNQVKAKLVREGPCSATELAQRYADLRREKAKLDEEESAINLQIEGVSQLLADAYEAEGITSLRLADGATVRVQPEPYAQVDDRETFRSWCIAQGLERLLILPFPTMNAITKERLLNGEPEPDGVRVFVKNKLFFQP